ncbi:interferon-stimulated 20 kDa exonuclease-like 2 [Oenanthe melanoleuca]|uniref:interferon-stimulated 20 kDa exonuclease-like 2 n=1 Tax=Oenanthe melanoleuca TaxID=2939378 RepID=UPI0024C1DFBB|nr:interferon-stimulated 20 kDa exonuclease-like 2 [Oenanthe melanoleuca]
MDDVMLNVDFAVPECRPTKEPGNLKHQRFVRRRRELERRGVLRQKQLPAAPGPGHGKKPRRKPREKGPAAARCPPASQNGIRGKSRGTAIPASQNGIKGKSLGTAIPASQNGIKGKSLDTAVPASQNGIKKSRGAAVPASQNGRTGIKGKSLGTAVPASQNGIKGKSRGSAVPASQDGIKGKNRGSAVPASQNGPTGTKGKSRGSAVGAPPTSQHDSAGTARAKSKEKGLGAPPAPPKLVAVDCEMVGTGPGGRTSSLARCSIVSYEGDVLYDQYVRPEAPIVDYRTRWSGIRPQHMARAVPFRRAQREVLSILAGKVVVGHAIHNDFKALHYSHPKALTRDTSHIPLLNRRAGFQENISISLKRLTKALLNQDIQMGRSGHSSVEDARATMELYKVVEEEWEQHLQQSQEKK